MTEQKTNLREANAKVFVVGVISEKDLKEVVQENKKKITGYITVKTSDVNFIRFSVNVNEKTNSGNDNKCYAGIYTVMNEYRSIAEVGEEEATRVKVTGEIRPFIGRNGEKIIMYKSNFFHRLKQGEDFNPQAEYSIEMFISSITPELTTDGEETGRIIVSGWMPTYNGIESIELKADKETAQAVENSFEHGQTVEFYGDIVNNRIETVTEVPVKIGKPRRKVSVEIKNDLVITGASEAYQEGVTLEKPYEEDVIKAAIQERKNKLEENKAKMSASGNTKPSGKAHGRTLGF